MKIARLFSILMLIVIFNVTTISAQSLPDKPDSLVVGHEPGNIAPDIILFSPDNNEYKLSDLRGELVLLHFWSSVCSLCKIENPKLVGIYKKYHDKSFVNGEKFEIFSVSIDVIAADWQKAIERDHMPWKYQVCSRLGWKSEVVKLYDFHKTPSTFLIDQNGIIIAKNVWGEGLTAKLQEFLEAENR
jgi:thiol-disulfide isomerase/thioredoxin